jgi:hypothetical protein
MASERFELRIPIPKLLVGALLTVLPISVAGLFTLNHSQSALEQTIGTHFRTIAEFAAAETSQFIHDRVTSVGALAATPVVAETAAAANRTYAGMDEAAIASRIERLEKSWNTPAGNAAVSAILANPASRALRRYLALDRRFLRITVTDEKGAVVAATHKTLDYYQADEDFWTAIYAQGRGAVSLTDILYDDVTKSYYIGVGVPILEEGTNRFIGALDALLEVSALFPMLHRAQLGATAEVQLVKDDGTIIAAPNVNLAMKVKSEEFAALKDARPEIVAGYLVTTIRTGATRIIGYADTGLRADYGSLGWTVLVNQDASQALAPIRYVSRLLSFMALVGLLASIFLIAYFSLHRERKLLDLQETPEKTAATPEP